MYFNADNSFDAALVAVFLRRLRSIESWFSAQSSYRFIASSLLFVYSGEAVRCVDDNNTAKHAVDLSPASHCSTTHSSNVDCAARLSNGCAVAGSVNGADAHSSVDVSDKWWDRHADVKMIDFTHAFVTSSTDDNYLTGLRSVIAYMSQLTCGTYTPDPR